MDKEQSPQKSRFLDSQVYKDKSARDGSDERSRSTSTAGRPYNINAGFVHDVTRTNYVQSKRVKKPAPFQPVRSTIVMPMPVPSKVQELEQ